MSKKDINLETSQIAWHELQRFFASGLAISVSKNIDLVEAAYQVSQDNKEQVEQWLADNIIAPVSDQQALKWYEEDTRVWAVVIKPWVFVQESMNA
ncbi:MAG: DUF2288 domain-containing protein [Methylococcales bacterium]|nr:DUF2288 domain-containing protein [Methylococcales bacterium]